MSWIQNQFEVWRNSRLAHIITRTRTPEQPRSRKRRILRGLLLAVLVFLLTPYIITLVYLVIDPPFSAYMLRQRLTGHAIKHEWRDIDEISDALVLQVIVAEDDRFCHHHGVDWRAINIVLNQSGEGGPSRGASTLSMQTAKNVFLWNSPASIRKIFEIPLAYYMNVVLGKRRIMEIYLNVAQWGPNIYGAEAAAQYHFGVSAKDLTPDQAALLAATLPNPLDRDAGDPGETMMAIAEKLRSRAEREKTDIRCVLGRKARMQPKQDFDLDFDN